MTWTPHATVATLVKRNGKFLLVEERSHGKTVFNQPAGHIEEGETIQEAAIRETLEETGWHIELTGFLGIYTYTAPQNGVCYYRFCFTAKALEKTSNALDQDIIAAHWLSIEEIRQLGDKLRSPLVLKCFTDGMNRPAMPLNTLYEHPVQP